MKAWELRREARLDARAISQKTYVGDATLDIVSTKPLLVRPSTPRFFVVGDESELAVVVNNNTDQELSVDVALDAKGVTLKAEYFTAIKKAGFFFSTFYKAGHLFIIVYKIAVDTDALAAKL